MTRGEILLSRAQRGALIDGVRRANDAYALLTTAEFGAPAFLQYYRRGIAELKEALDKLRPFTTRVRGRSRFGAAKARGKQRVRVKG